GAVVRTLKSAYACRRDLRTKENVLAGTLDDAPPTRVARDIHHRSKGPMDPGRACLGRRYGRSSLHHRQVPTRGLAERHWKDRPVAVDHIKTEKYGYLQP